MRRQPASGCFGAVETALLNPHARIEENRMSTKTGPESPSPRSCSAAGQNHGRINCRSSLEETNPVAREIQEIIDAAFGRGESGPLPGIFASQGAGTGHHQT